MSDDIVPKKDADAIFKKLRKDAANKNCIDCPTNNPTWATIPHGSFLCLDCAGHHRNLGVHLSFVRSTGMDEWTWNQIRMMQVGGNARAEAYYKSKGLTTSDITDKYNSRVAASYRSLLEKDAQKLHKKLGTKLFEEVADAGAGVDEPDFFDGAAAEAAAAPAMGAGAKFSAGPTAEAGGELTASLGGAKGAAAKPGKPAKKLLLKKPAKKKKAGGGLGAKKKKGGATNFDEIESKVKAGDEEREKMSAEEAATVLAEQSLQKKMEKFAVKTKARDLKSMDDAKLAQAERLGMGMGRQVASGLFAHSSSAASEEVVQEAGDQSTGFYDREPRGGFHDREPTADHGADDFFSSYGN